jgi:hypothetical protein
LALHEYCRYLHISQLDKTWAEWAQKSTYKNAYGSLYVWVPFLAS